MSARDYGHTHALAPGGIDGIRPRVKARVQKSRIPAVHGVWLEVSRRGGGCRPAHHGRSTASTPAKSQRRRTAWNFGHCCCAVLLREQFVYCFRRAVSRAKKCDVLFLPCACCMARYKKYKPTKHAARRRNNPLEPNGPSLHSVGV